MNMLHAGNIFCDDTVIYNGFVGVNECNYVPFIYDLDNYIKTNIRNATFKYSDWSTYGLPRLCFRWGYIMYRVEVTVWNPAERFSFVPTVVKLPGIFIRSWKYLINVRLGCLQRQIVEIPLKDLSRYPRGNILRICTVSIRLPYVIRNLLL